MEPFDYRSNALEVSAMLQNVTCDIQNYIKYFHSHKTFLGAHEMQGVLEDLVCSIDKHRSGLADHYKLSSTDLEDTYSQKLGGNSWPVALEWRKESGIYGLHVSILDFLAQCSAQMSSHLSRPMQSGLDGADVNNTRGFWELISRFLRFDELDQEDRDIVLQTERLELLTPLLEDFNDSLTRFLFISRRTSVTHMPFNYN